MSSENIAVKQTNRLATAKAVDNILKECANIHEREYCWDHCDFASRCDLLIISLDENKGGSTQ